MSDEALRKLTDAIVAAQASAFLARDIAAELMLDIARSHDDPERYIKDLFERVAARFDPTSEEIAAGFQKRVIVEARELAEIVFRRAQRALRGKGGEPSRREPPRE